jgi:hypothetical protein
MEFKYAIRIHIKDNGKQLDKQKINLSLTETRQIEKSNLFRQQSISF